MTISTRGAGIRHRALLAGGVVVLLIAFLWMPVVVPMLQKLPKSINDTLHYRGTFTTQLDAATGATLPAPVVTPLSIDRHVQTDPARSGARQVLARETMTIHIGDKTQVMNSSYLIDRRTMRNIPDAATVVTKPGTYSINLPFGTSSGTKFQIWRAETGTSYPLQPAAGAKTSTIDGLRVRNMSAVMPATPVTPQQQKALSSQGLPLALSAPDMEARMTAAGVDVAAAGPALAKVLAPQEVGQVLYAFSAWTPLRYELSSGGRALVEPRTGMIVSVGNVTESLSAKPDLSGVATTLAMLQRHNDVPEIASLLTKLTAAANAPGVPVYTLHYSQTPSSVASRVKAAKAASNTLWLVRQVVPLALAFFGALLLMLGIRTRQHRHQTREGARHLSIHRPGHAHASAA